MKRKISLILITAVSLLSISACSFSMKGETNCPILDEDYKPQPIPWKEVNVIENDGEVNTIQYINSFEYQPTEKKGKLFMGCFEKPNLNSKKLVDRSGKAIYDNVELPKNIYTNYLDTNEVQIIDFNFPSVDISCSNKSKSYELKLSEDYQYYLQHTESVGYLTIKFSHYEKEEGVVGINTFNWVDYRLDTQISLIDSGTFRSNDDYTVFNRMYKLDKEEILKGIKFTVSRPKGCISTAPSKISPISMKLYLGTEALLEEYKYVNLNKSYAGLCVTSTFEDNSATINSTYSSNASLKYKLPFNLKEWIAESPTEYITYTINIYNYGRKLLLLCNWINGSFILNNQYKTSIHLESNNGADLDSFSIKVPKSDALFIEEVMLNLNHPTANASSMFYYVWSVSLSVTRT